MQKYAFSERIKFSDWKFQNLLKDMTKQQTKEINEKLLEKESETFHI
jgi:hypothetical protein